MDKEKNTRLPLVDLIEVKPMQDGYRWVAITAMLFAIGIILHTVSPNVGGVTPNWTIAMYSIVINLTNPTLSQAVGIGFIAGITLVPSSKSAFPLGNIASELSGAITCCILVKAMLHCGLGKWKLHPLVTGFLATMASGGVFTFILKINGGVWGAINFNNMIPIHSDQLEHIDIRILPTDDKAWKAPTGSSVRHRSKYVLPGYVPTISCQAEDGLFP